MTIAKFIYDTSSRSLDLYYATRFTVYDPVIFLDVKGKKYLIVDTLEVDRAKKTATVYKVFKTSYFKEGFELRRSSIDDVTDIMKVIFKKLKITKLEVPFNFPIAIADKLRAKKCKLIIKPFPFYPQRTVKTNSEKKEMIEAQKQNFKLFSVVEKILKKAKIKGQKIYYNGKPLTAEFVRTAVKIEAMNIGLNMPEEPIISCGEQATDPHNIGSGVLKAHQPIIVDIFPVSQKTLFYGDATRTFCKGKAPEKLKKLYSTVKQAQEMGLKLIRAGVNGKNIHQAIVNSFEAAGYKTGEIDGYQQGFIHGTGHGIGLEIHENPPFIAKLDCILKSGNVTSVEPGLYYKGIGGVRIEDLVYVTKTGCEVLSSYPKKLEVV